VRSFLNSPIANTVSAITVAMLYLGDDAQVLNEGSARAIEVLTRPGSIVDPVMLAPVVACTSLTAAAAIEAVLMAMETPAENVAIAGFARRFRFALAGTDRQDQPYIWHFFFNKGGAGASVNGDGWTNLGGIHNPGGTPAPSIEGGTEANYPFLVETYALKPGSVERAGSAEARAASSGCGTKERPTRFSTLLEMEP
jgi:N-methylhydantoinase B